MLAGLNVEISKEYRERTEAPYLGRWFKVISINGNKEITLQAVLGGSLLTEVKVEDIAWGGGDE